jgi:poly-beta-1,6-N-acetyl-D-glucosamine synthase
MTPVREAAFWFFVDVSALLLWAHGGYLVFLRLLSIFLHKQRPMNRTGEVPTVTAVVLVHNEEDTVIGKIEDLLALDYPVEKFSVLVASDGSTDGTNQLVDLFGSPRVKLIESKARCGRAQLSNEAAAAAESEWLLFTDADTRMASDFLTRLSPHLSDPAVAVVDGALVSKNSRSSAFARDVGIYWKYESKLKRLESAAGCLASTFGACTAVRRRVFRPLRPTEDIDFTTPLDALSLGYRVIHEQKARAFDRTPATVGTQFRARVRMVTKNLPGTLRKMDLRIFRQPLVVISIVSHKLLRWFTPLLLIALLLLNVLLVGSPVFQLLLVGQLIFYSLGVAGAVGLAFKRELPLASSVFSFLLANAGFFVGIVNALRGLEIAYYEPDHSEHGAVVVRSLDGKPTQ